MSMFSGYFTYESASRIAAIRMYNDPMKVYQRYASTERLVFNLRYSILLALLSGLFFAFAILDGAAPGGIKIRMVLIVIVGLLLLTSVPILFSHIGIRIFRRFR